MADITYNDHPEKAGPAASDFIPIWDVSGNAAKKVLRSVLVGAVLTGAGTIATGGHTLTMGGNSQINGQLNGAGVIETGGFTLTIPATGTAVLPALPQTWTARQSLAAGAGLQGSKAAVANNSATNLCDVIIGGSSALAASYLIGLTVTGGSTASGQTWVLTQGYSVGTITKLNEALYGHSSIALTATTDFANRKVRIGITQINGSSQACTVNISVLPLMVQGDPAITLTML